DASTSDQYARRTPSSCLVLVSRRSKFSGAFQSTPRSPQPARRRTSPNTSVVRRIGAPRNTLGPLWSPPSPGEAGIAAVRPFRVLPRAAIVAGGMWFHVLAADYDGTLASDGRIAPDTLVALRRVRESGRRVVLVTGRQFEDLLRVCPEIDTFDLVVAENGAVLFDPGTRQVDDLGDPPPPALLAGLEHLGVPLSTGRIIISTVVPHEREVLTAIRSLGLEFQIIFNKESVMVLPSGVSKESGLRAALQRLGRSLHNTVGVGDAENDH